MSPETILITGAAGGIGRALALAYAEPARILLLHGRDAGKLDELRLECEQRGATVILLVCDLANHSQWMADLGVISQASPVDLVIVNAGTTNAVGIDGEAWPDIERVLDVNVRGAMATIAALLPAMRQRGRGQIALISSLSAHFGIPVTPAYCASKAALKAYGESLRGWLAPQGIAVNVVLPGFVDTPMSAKFPAPKPFLLTPESAAQRIRIGLAKNEGRITFPRPLAQGMWMLSVLPAAWSQWILQRLGFGGAGRS